MSNPVKPIPDGYQAVIPYLVVQGAEALIEFMTRAFGAVELLRMKMPDGTIGHCEVRIRDSVVMIGEGRDQYKPMPSMLYVYVPDVDETYRRAIEAGATSTREPKNQFYGDRTAGVQDMCGNHWYIGTHVEDVPEEELMRRQQAASGTVS